MTENFGDAMNAKKKRGNFMGNVKEIVKVPKPVVKAPAPLPEKTTEIVESVETVAETVKPEEKTTLQKGFVVGYTEDGVVKLQPFGGLSELELVGLIEYAKIKAGDMLNRIARTSMSDIAPIKEGVTILAQSIKALLTGGQDQKAAS